MLVATDPPTWVRMEFGKTNDNEEVTLHYSEPSHWMQFNVHFWHGWPFKNSKYCRQTLVRVHIFLWVNLLIKNYRIDLPWPENPANTCDWHTEILDSCFDLIRSHQWCLPWSSPLEIEPATTDCRAETLPLRYWSTSHTSDAKLISDDNCAAN